MRVLSLAAGLTLGCYVALGQPPSTSPPQINPGGVVNAANYDRRLAPASVGSIFGSNLATSTVTAQTTPLPLSLNGTSVQVNGTNVPLFFVSATQINFQVPTALFTTLNLTNIPVTVTTAAGRSNIEVFYGFTQAPRIFTLDGSGCGAGAILNVKSDGTASLNSPTNSAQPGEYLAVFATGFGGAVHGPPDGFPAPISPVVYTDFPAILEFDSQPSALANNGAVYVSGFMPNFTGLAPGTVGVDQLNVKVPDSVREGCAVPVVLSGADYQLGQSIPVSIHRGGGTCADPHVNASGQVQLIKSVTAGANTLTYAETVTAQFDAWPGKPIPPVGPPSLAFTDPPTEMPPPFCPIPGYSHPAPGPISLNGAGMPQASFSPQTTNGLTSYQGQLPTGTLKQGNYTVRFSGDQSIAGFAADAVFGEDITVTGITPTGPGFSGYQQISVRWTGGTPDQQVVITFVSHEGQGAAAYTVLSRFTTPAEAHVYYINGDPGLPILPSQDLEILVDVMPANQYVPVVYPAGIDLGVQIWCIYRHRYTGYRIG